MFSVLLSVDALVSGGEKCHCPLLSALCQRSLQEVSIHLRQKYVFLPSERQNNIGQGKLTEVRPTLVWIKTLLIFFAND